MVSADVIQLQSHCGIRTAQEHHAAVLGAFRARDAIEIDAGRVEDVDLTLLQLLVSATKTANASQKRFKLVGVSDPLRRALARAGLRLSSSDDQINWA